MSSQRDQQIEMRLPVMDFLTNGQNADRTVGGGIVIGVAMVLELIDEKGERGILKMTSDASGVPLPYYLVEGMSNALTDLDEFDDNLEED